MYQAQVTQVKLNENLDRYEVSIEVFDRHGGSMLSRRLCYGFHQKTISFGYLAFCIL